MPPRSPGEGAVGRVVVTGRVVVVVVGFGGRIPSSPPDDVPPLPDEAGVDVDPELVVPEPVPAVPVAATDAVVPELVPDDGAGGDAVAVTVGDWTVVVAGFVAEVPVFVGTP
jgi:hypothetical protein